MGPGVLSYQGGRVVGHAEVQEEEGYHQERRPQTQVLLCAAFAAVLALACSGDGECQTQLFVVQVQEGH